MFIVKVNNLTQANGKLDYKGLDINKIVGGTQLYPSYDNVAYFFYDGEVNEGGDIQIITQATYDSHKIRIDEENASFITPEKRIEQLESELAVAKEDNVSNMLAITELYEMILGGTTT